MPLKHQTSIMTLSLCLLSASMFWLFPSFAFVFFISLLLSLLLSLPLTKLKKALPKTSPALLSALILGLFILFMLSTLAIISSTLIPGMQSLASDLPKIARSIQISPLFTESEFLSQQMDELWNELASLGLVALKSSLSMLISIFRKVIDLVMIFFITFYLLKDGKRIKKFIVNIFPKKNQERIHTLLTNILNAFRTYIITQITICFITGTVVYIYFSLNKLDYAIVFAVFSGLSEFVPVLGPTVASAVGILFTATISPFEALQALFFYLLLTQINHNLLYPSLVGKKLGLHPVAIILSILLGNELLGVAGMFLAVPALILFRLVIIDVGKNWQVEKM